MTPQQLVAERVLREELHPSSAVAEQAYREAAIKRPVLPDDLAREVYCVLGIPIDAVDTVEVLRRIKSAASAAVPYLISTPNLNFLTSSRSDAEFRESVLQSDLCPADGMPIVWMARLMGLPIRERVAGSDIFDKLKAERRSLLPLKVFLFGGAEGVAAAAGQALNGVSCGLTCVGSMHPGYDGAEQMSSDEIIDTINASRADFLAVALGAGKGQAWLRRNHHRLRIPVRSHMGAVINFQAGNVKRAPVGVRKLGFEWLWRIKEEPHLWRRYARDGMALLQLLLTRVMPLAIAMRWQRLKSASKSQDLLVKRSQVDNAIVLTLAGAATAAHVDKAIAWFRDVIATTQPIVIDLSGVQVIDARFIGLLLMFRKVVREQSRCLNITGVSPHMARMFRLHGAEYLLTSDKMA